jgi:ATP-dependent DNA helicase RecG
MSRPFAIDPLFRALTALPGVGQRIGTLMEKLVGGPKVLDVLWHLPIDVVDRRFAPTIADAPDEQVATMAVTIGRHSPNARRGMPYRVKCSDDTGEMGLVFFHGNKGWIEKQIPEGADVIVSGKVEYYQGNGQMVHPEVATPEDRASLETVEPIYPLTQGVTNKVLRKAAAGAMEFVPALEEWLEPTYQAKQKWRPWHEAIRAAHMPDDPSGVEAMHPDRQRLAYDELLANQLTLELVRHRQRKLNGRSYEGNGELRAAMMDALPFTLTGAQARCLSEIDADMSAKARMLRLLQGDVGSGKTVVAALAMIRAIECGAQAVIMAPTEILARQHGESMAPLFEACGVHCVVLTGRDKGKAREEILMRIASGEAQVIIGTHAVFQNEVVYADLGMAVIDEQHRFGVQQRLALSSKGKGVDVLVMTATPIPRTLTLTAYGDMDVSRIDEKPPGRKPVETRLIPQGKIEDMIEGLQRQVAKGARVYWVCPLVEESELIDLSNAEERYDVMKHYFGERVGLIHGRMKGDEKDAVMEKFAGGDLDILVATTVIEVGVNVPEATIMVIEHAERFGLSQLHQLRGRVGRGGDQSYCFLVYVQPLGTTAQERLSVMRSTEDGFVIAERDLELRGSGDILGVKQSGALDFKMADLAAHGELLAAARDDARLIIERDPELESERGLALKTLLYLFERDQAIAYLRSG